MRILMDECVDEHLRDSFSKHDCQTVRYAGFAGLKNGALLKAAESASFDILLTVDQGFQYEQNLSGRSVALLIIRARSNRLRDLLPHVPACLQALESIRSGQIVTIGP